MVCQYVVEMDRWKPKGTEMDRWKLKTLVAVPASLRKAEPQLVFWVSASPFLNIGISQLVKFEFASGGTATSVLGFRLSIFEF